MRADSLEVTGGLGDVALSRQNDLPMAIPNHGSVPNTAGSFLDSFRRHEAQRLDPDVSLSDALDQALEPYHSQLIALGSSIGTGLFLASGEGLADAGPISLLMAFSFVGFTLAPTVFAMAEMATLLPEAGGFFHHTRMFVHPAWAAAIGWNYAFQWMVVLPVEIVAATIAFHFWENLNVHSSIWVTIFLALIVLLNIFGVKIYAHAEVVLSMMKVVSVVGFIILGTLIDLGLGFRRSDTERAVGFSNWYDPGPVHNGWWGFCSVLITAAFSYSGTEMVGMTAAEQRDPKRDMPKAMKKVFWRIGLFYILSIFVVGLLVGYTDPNLTGFKGTGKSQGSPFVIAIGNAGVHALPSMFNITILITVFSVANSSVYGSSRVLIALAHAGMAPRQLAYIDRKGRPLFCLLIAFAFGLLAYLSALKDVRKVFDWLKALCGLSAVFSWTTICYTHLRFRQALDLRDPIKPNVRLHRRPPSSLPYTSPLGVWGSRIGLLCNCFIIVVQLLTAVVPVNIRDYSKKERAQNFFQSFMAFPLVIFIFLAYRYWQGTTMVDLRSVDFGNAWYGGDYVLYALAHPEEFPPESFLEWVQKKIELSEEEMENGRSSGKLRTWLVEKLESHVNPESDKKPPPHEPFWWVWPRSLKERIKSIAPSFNPETVPLQAVRVSTDVDEEYEMKQIDPLQQSDGTWQRSGSRLRNMQQYSPVRGEEDDQIRYAEPLQRGDVRFQQRDMRVHQGDRY